MKKSHLILVLLFIFSCKSVKHNSYTKSQTIFLNNIKIIENYNNGKVIKNGIDLDNASIFLEELTKIKANIDEGYEFMIAPTEENLRQWKKWYIKNKDKLYFDEKEQKVKVKIS